MKVFKAQAILCLCLLSFGSILGQAANQAPTPHAESTQPHSSHQLTWLIFCLQLFFFSGQAASVQSRNSGGIRFGDKSLMLISLVDTFGYSSQVQEKYQAYLITESTLDIDGHRLVPGAYGCGFLGNSGFIVMDIGGHDLFTAQVAHDTNLRRPTPLQIVAAPDEPGKYRLYAGRNYVTFRLAGRN